jgi:peptidoglycan/xylan/chitin deacetylase (PgdA/CDA1 family)
MSSWLKLDVERFERQIVILKKLGRFIRPDALLHASRSAGGGLNLLMTFDDGMVNTYRLGLPVLQRHGVPALFFISTWHMETGEPFWFERLIRAVLDRRGGDLDLRHLGLGQYRFKAAGGEEGWSEIQRLLEDVKCRDEEQDGWLVERVLLEMKGVALLAGRFGEVYRPLGRDEILAMRDSGLCSFGSHAHRHRLLTKLDDHVLMEDLGQSRDLLQNLLGETVEHIAYPNGDVDGRVEEVCRRLGFRFGYTVTPGRIGRNTDRLRIPRVLVGGFDSPLRLVLNLARCLLIPGPQADRGLEASA